MSCFCCCGKKQSLKDEDLKDLKTQTQFTEEELKLWYKNFLDDYPTGFVSKEEFKSEYTKFFPYGDASTFVDHIFRTFDKDNSGTMEFKEFIVALSLTAKGTPQQKLRWAFAIYDIDNSGSIDIHEMAEIFKAIDKLNNGPHDDISPYDKAKSVMKEMDINEDGMISLEEFVQGINQCPTLLKPLEMDHMQ